jgi:drug/metabolite transporter (DMT)-like permease
MSSTATSYDRPSSASRWLIPALLACYLVWGSTYLAIRFALVSFPPCFQMGSRFLVTGALLMAWMRWRATQLATAAIGARFMGIFSCIWLARGI